MTTPRTVHLVATAVFCLGILPGAVMDLVQPDMVVQSMQAIDLPLYLLTLIGIWKLAGIAALAIPGLRRVREWAYAGFFFDLTGAAYAHWAGGDPLVPILIPLAFLLPLGMSYASQDRLDAVQPVGSPATA